MFGLSSQCSLAQETFSIFQDVDVSGRPVRKVCKINFPVEYCLLILLHIIIPCSYVLSNELKQ